MSSFANTVIPYYPVLSSKFGSVTSAILYRQLLYWFKKMEYKPFYKFLKPCEHGAYKTGESWTEELSMTETEFRTAFQKIGIAYKSKKDFDNAENKFIDDKGEEKYFCSYIDRLERKTYYFMNNELVKKLDFEINYINFPINEENYFLEIKKPISRNEESQFLETKKAISNNSRLPVDYHETTTVNECVENSEITDKQAEYRNKVESKKLIIKDLITLNRLNLNIDKITEACKGNFDLVIQNIKTVCQNRSKFGNLEGAIMSSIKDGYEVKIKPGKTSKSEFEFNQERFDRINKLVEVADVSALTNKDRDYYNKCQEYLRG